MAGDAERVRCLVSIGSTTHAHHDAAGMHLGQEVLTALEKTAAEEGEKAPPKGAAPKNKADTRPKRPPSGRNDDGSAAGESSA